MVDLSIYLGSAALQHCSHGSPNYVLCTLRVSTRHPLLLLLTNPCLTWVECAISTTASNQKVSLYCAEMFVYATWKVAAGWEVGRRRHDDDDERMRRVSSGGGLRVSSMARVGQEHQLLALALFG